MCGDGGPSPGDASAHLEGKDLGTQGGSVAVPAAFWTPPWGFTRVIDLGGCCPHSDQVTCTGFRRRWRQIQGWKPGAMGRFEQESGT